MTPPYSSSIKYKVIAVIMAASVTVLLLTVAAFIVYDLVSFRHELVRNLTTQGQIIAGNSSGSLAFKNENDATNVLSSLRTDPHITAAALYDSHNVLFARYPPQVSDAALPAAPGAAGCRFEDDSLIVFEPVMQDDAWEGTLFMRSDLTAISQRLHLYGAISIMIMLGSLLVAFLLSNTLQRLISVPVIRLAETARRISEQTDYSLRAPKLSNDELGLLTDWFNNMVDRMEAGNRALRNREAQFRLVTDHAPVLLAHFDREFRYKFVNVPYAERFGFQPAEVIGRPAADIKGLELFGHMRPYMEEALAGRDVRFEIKISGAGREERWSHVEYTPEQNAAGEVVGFVAVHTDITERKRTELEVAHARDQAVAASRAKDDFLAALSHELRTPLNPVLLAASAAAANARLPADIRADFELIRRNVELEARLIDDLLDLTRITRGKLSLDLQPLDVVAILKDALKTVQADAEQKNISLGVDYPSSPCRVMADPVRLRQIFWNVLKNAVKFTPEAGRITVRVRAPGAGAPVAIEILDTGIGMTPDEIRQAFDPFKQGEHAGPSGSHRFGGLGLGLAISRMLVELQSGTIRATSDGRGQGSAFTIEFPALADAAPPPEGVASGGPAVAVAPVSSSGRNGIRILLIEDHEATRLLLVHLLERRRYRVTAAATAAEARERAASERFDLVVSDIGLPDGSGYDLMLDLHASYGLQGIALTGYGMEDDINRARNSGFTVHLTKPVSMESLEKALQEFV